MKINYSKVFVNCVLAYTTCLLLKVRAIYDYVISAIRQTRCIVFYLYIRYILHWSTRQPYMFITTSSLIYTKYKQALFRPSLTTIYKSLRTLQTTERNENLIRWKLTDIERGWRRKEKVLNTNLGKSTVGDIHVHLIYIRNSCPSVCV